LCGGEIHENYKKFQCQKCDFSLWKIVAGRQLEIPEVEELIAKRQVGPLQGFRSKMGRPFAAVIKLDENHAPSFDFGNDESDGEEVDFSGQEPLGKCPKCGANVFEQPMAYVCEKSVGAAKNCDFRSGKVILQQEMSRAEMQKLLESGKTSLLKGFVSNRTRKKFSAYLVRGADGKVGFEFEQRAPKAPKATAAKTENVGSGDTVKAPAKTTKAAAAKSTTAKKPAAKKKVVKKAE
jgi:DNA topoisomerase-3